MSRANIDEASSPLAVIEHVGERSRTCKMQNTRRSKPYPLFAVPAKIDTDNLSGRVSAARFGKE